jgi:hypothetical protein
MYNETSACTTKEGKKKTLQFQDLCFHTELQQSHVPANFKLSKDPTTDNMKCMVRSMLISFK